MTSLAGKDTGLRLRKPNEPTSAVEADEDIVPTAKSSGWVTFYVTLAALSVPIIMLAAMEEKIDAQPIPLQEPPPWRDSPELNNELQASVIYFKDKLHGAESLASAEGYLYTGAYDGAIYKLIPKSNTMEKLTSFGKGPCTGPETEHTCGRPLGMRIDKAGYLWVLDAYLGLFQVNPATGDYLQYFSSAALRVDGEELNFLNDLDIDRDGIIYMTDTSTRWTRREFMYSMLEGDHTGRVLQYDTVMNTTKVLVKDLYFANGLQLSRDQSFLLVAETSMARIQKYHLKGEKAGQMEIFADNLPGIPDNIRLCSSGGYWVGVATCRSSNFFSFDTLARLPLLRSIIAKVVPTKTILRSVKPCGMVVQLNNDGEVVKILTDLDGKVIQSVSEVHDEAGLLTLGSFKAPYLAQLDTRSKPWQNSKS